MKKILGFLTAMIGLGLLLSGCGAAKLSPEVQKRFDNNATMYTTRNMHYNFYRSKKIVDTTNYQVGTLIPINSKVKMKAVNAKQIVFLYKNQEIILRNIAKYSHADINQIAKRYFSMHKVNLNKFTAKERKAIHSAQVVSGMRKDAVIVSLGTPPAHVTPTLKMDQWKYWKNRWSTFLVNFKNGKTVK